MKWVVIFGILLISLLVWSCSSPRVSINALSPEGKSIRRWKLTWEGQINQVGRFNSESAQPVDLKQSKIDSLVSCFMDEVRKDLRDDYGLEFYDNPPFDGTIVIVLQGQMKAEPGIDREYTRIWEHHDANPWKVQDTTLKDIVHEKANLDDRIDAVRVYFTGQDNRLLGKESIYYDQSAYASPKKVKPEHVAEAIAQMLR